MSNIKKIKKLSSTSSIRSCSDLPDLVNELDKIANGKACIFMAEDNKRLIFAEIDSNSDPIMSKAIALDLPCPPYCGDESDVATV